MPFERDRIDDVVQKFLIDTHEIEMITRRCVNFLWIKEKL